jgi:hypothetical protein
LKPDYAWGSGVHPHDVSAVREKIDTVWISHDTFVYLRNMTVGLKSLLMSEVGHVRTLTGSETLSIISQIYIEVRLFLSENRHTHFQWFPDT